MDLYFKAEAASGGLDFEYNKGLKNNFVNTPFTAATGATVANVMRFFPIWIRENVNIIDFSINITVGAAGALVFGLYESVEGVPKNLLFQNTIPFDTSITGIQTEILPSPYSIKSGIYYIAINSDSTPTITLIPNTTNENVIGANGFSGIFTEARYAYSYTGTLPTTAGNPTNRFYASRPNVLFTIS